MMICAPGMAARGGAVQGSRRRAPRHRPWRRSPWLTIEVASARSGVPLNVLRRAARAGELPSRRVGKRLHLPAAIVPALKAELRRPIVGERRGSSVVAVTLDDDRHLTFRCPFCGDRHVHGIGAPDVPGGARAPHCRDDTLKPARHILLQVVPPEHPAATPPGREWDWGAIRAAWKDHE